MVDAQAKDLFLSLTPEKVLAAVEAGGLRCRPVCYPLNSFENRVYEVELEDRSRIVAKFYRPGRWSEEQILEEHRFLAELDAAELPVATVRPFPDGSTLKQIDHIYYSLADRRGGRAPDELDDATVERLGHLVGRLHLVGAQRPMPSRPRLTADHYVRRTVRWLQEHQTLPPSLAQRYTGAALSLADLTDRKMEGVETHRIHADLHTGNLLFRDGLLRVLDFDDMVTGPAVQDLWLALPGRDPASLAQREIFLDAYQQWRPFDRRTLGLIECLRGLRLVRYAGWLARRWDDPAFRQGWPHFGSEDYWLRETEDLEEQLGLVEGEIPPEEAAAYGLEPKKVEEEAELTNKDFFWDWEGD